MRFAAPGQYLDAVLPAVRSGQMELPVTRSGARLSWTSFWIQCPKVKAGYRHAEHALQSAEAAATVASLKSGYRYPVQPLYHAWLQMLLNMDRNTLWGAAGGMVFEHPRSWDVQDRFEWVESASDKTQQAALRALLGKGDRIGLFNPLGWKRSDPVRLNLVGARLIGTPCQVESDARTLCCPQLPSLGTTTIEEDEVPAPNIQFIPLPRTIETRFYTATIDLKSGAITGLKLKPSGREMLAGPVLLVAEKGGDGHNTPPRPQRQRLADSGRFPAKVRASQGPLATAVAIESTFHGGGKSYQTIHFCKDSPRIDFDVELNDIPNQTVVVAEFPLAQAVKEIRRGIPYGFSHGAWGTPNPDLPGYADGIQAAVRWSHYTLANGGVAILDRGLPGRELTGNTPVLFLLNAQDTYMGYPGGWLSGKGKQCASFALVAHDGDWKDARVQRMAWEYNCPPVVVHGVAKAGPASFVETSDNVIVEAVRREGKDIELRMVECLGVAGTARVSVSLPHRQAALTDLVGARAQPLSGGPQYEFPVRPQQIVTMRLSTSEPVPEIEPLLKWDELVPPKKLAALKARLQGRKGHPPLGSQGPGTEAPTLPADAAMSLTLGKKATASNVYQNMAAHEAAMAVDGDPGTRWATDGSVSQATLEVELGKPQLIGRAYLSEAYNRVRKFELQALRGGKWETFARGGRIGTNLEISFPPITAQHVRLNLTEAPGGPTIWEFLLFGPK
jgi:hypothetical protein